MPPTLLCRRTKSFSFQRYSRSNSAQSDLSLSLNLIISQSRHQDLKLLDLFTFSFSFSLSLSLSLSVCLLISLSLSLVCVVAWERDLLTVRWPPVQLCFSPPTMPCLNWFVLNTHTQGLFHSFIQILIQLHPHPIIIIIIKKAHPRPHQTILVHSAAGGVVRKLNNKTILAFEQFC